MASFNRVVLLGNLTADPEVRYTASELAIVDVGVAINERVKRGGEYVDEVSYIDVTFFGRTAEVAGEYLSKGAPALIEGRLKQERWQTDDGQRRSRVKVIAERLTLLGRRDRKSQQADPVTATAESEF